MKKSVILLLALVLIYGCSGQDTLFGKAIAPDQSCISISKLEIINDRAVPRNNELAFSGIPVPRNFNGNGLLSTSNLVVFDENSNQPVPAQFRALSRWAAGPNDNAPIQWLEVSLTASVSAALAEGQLARKELELFNCPTPPSGLATTSLANGLVINTGVAQFQLTNSPAIFQSITYNGNQVHTGGGGPRLVDGNNQELSAADTQCQLVDNGVIKAVVECKGHFGTDQQSSCGQAPGFASRLTFIQGSGDVLLEFDLFNECGSGARPSDGEGQNLRYQVQNVRWDLPLNLVNPTTYVSGGNQIYEGQGNVRLEQHLGSLNNGVSSWRRASIRRAGTQLEQAEFFSRPIVAIGDQQVTATAQLAMMRYREPQALATSGNQLQLYFLSEPRRIGVAQGMWNFAKLSFSGPTTEQLLQQERDQGILKIERGLLVHAPVQATNAARVFPTLPSIQALQSGAGQLYLQIISDAHDNTVLAGRQWDRTKNYGPFNWPDYQFDREVLEFTTPEDHVGESDYWSATSSEFKQWFVDGDPKWIWDFSFWEENLLWKTIAYNPGSRCGTSGDTTSGFGVGVPGTGDGLRYRESQGSDDYFYNMGSDEGYAIRPNYGLRDAFGCAGNTFINRYEPLDPEPRTVDDRDVRLFVIIRQVSQHVNALRYAAQFVPQGNAAYQTELRNTMQEFVRDNLFGGIFCQDDTNNVPTCRSDAPFMNSAINFDVFRSYLYNWGDINGRIRAALVTHAREFFRQGMATGAGVNDRPGLANTLYGDWLQQMVCTFSSAGELQSCRAFPEGDDIPYNQERPSHLSALLMAHELDPSINFCNVARTVLQQAVQTSFYDADDGYFTRGAGWWKGAAQVLREVVHGIGIAETCLGSSVSPPSFPEVSSTQQPPPSSQQPAGQTPEGSGSGSSGSGGTGSGGAGSSGQSSGDSARGSSGQPLDNNDQDLANPDLGDVNTDNQLDLDDVFAVIDHLVGRNSLTGQGLVNALICSTDQPNFSDLTALIQAVVSNSVLQCPASESAASEIGLQFAVVSNSQDTFVEQTTDGFTVCSVIPNNFDFTVTATGSGSLQLSLDETVANGQRWLTFPGTEEWVAETNGQDQVSQRYFWAGSLAGVGEDVFTFRITGGEEPLRVMVVGATVQQGCSGANLGQDVDEESGEDLPETNSNQGNQIANQPGQTDDSGSGNTGSGAGREASASDNSLSFFVTSERVQVNGASVQGGNFGGLAGADAFCNLLGNEALASISLPGKIWRAYLSSSTVDAKDRIGSGPWYNAAGERIAANVADLHNTDWRGTAQIQTQFGDPVFGPQHDVVTGSTRQGIKFTFGSTEYQRVFNEWAGSPHQFRNNANLYCQDWTSDSSSIDILAVVGHSDWTGGIIDNLGVDDDYWNSDHVTGCDEARMIPDNGDIRIYCFATD